MQQTSKIYSPCVCPLFIKIKGFNVYSLCFNETTQLSPGIVHLELVV